MFKKINVLFFVTFFIFLLRLKIQAYPQKGSQWFTVQFDMKKSGEQKEKMKHPENFQIHGDKVVLTTYQPAHVPKYHEWMGDEEILILTGSERLTLEEEYAMQQDWENDEKKCTFIILSRELYEETNRNAESMIGDTNLFIHEDGHLEEEEGDTDANVEKAAEIEVMIAEKSFRRKGMAKEALLLMMEFAATHLHIYKYFAKIKADNIGSIKLFTSLGYVFHSENRIFNEVCYTYRNPKFPKDDDGQVNRSDEVNNALIN